MSESVSDRRAHPRVDTAIDLHVRHGEAGDVARLMTCNLSLGGLYCTSRIRFAEMTRLALRMILPGSGPDAGAPIDIQAVVVRCREVPSRTNGDPRYELALYFTQVDDEAKDRLGRYLDTVA